MSRLVHLFLQSYEADIVLDALRGLRLSFINRGLNTDGIDGLIQTVTDQIEVNKALDDWGHNT
ncbi:hypothetical protein [Risungbinella massiliensis]|uniref:hypothetical protein n=1 Tax=Risungbinella massiliensis TaxID=1329796 RepID=UPI0005CC75C1|nr:hypothetical protein [Risungbinella massiliensis]